jgi:hypothetical protein
MAVLCLITPPTVAEPAATLADATGWWKVAYAGPPKTGPKTVGSMLLDLKVEGNVVTGAVTIGSWPGEAPIDDGKLEHRPEGDQITFTATGHLSSTTGIPTCKFVVTMHDDEMFVTLTAIKNAGGPLQPGREYEYRGRRKTE